MAVTVYGSDTLTGEPYTTLLDSTLSGTDAPLQTVEWLHNLDLAVGQQRLLLFDGLDSGFGNSPEERERRTKSVSGLLATVNDQMPRLNNLRFKVLLREDIWRDVLLPNKSHLSAASAKLSWSDKTDYLRLALKQAWRSTAFRELLSGRLSRDGFNPKTTIIDYWPDTFISSAWIILAGERISGGRTAFTDNWVWARLADANGDHSPRTLVQLLAAATVKERLYEPGNPYSRSVLRPRALVDSLDSVSEQALDALSRDEFPELEPLLEVLRSIGITPFEAERLDGVWDTRSSGVLTQLAQEVGLLEPLSDARTGIQKFRVPELYRKALNMNRRGQA